MLVQHKLVQLPTGEFYTIKQEVSNVEFGSSRQPSDIVFFEYIGNKK